MKLLITRDLPRPVLDSARERFDVTLRDAPLTPGTAREALASHDALLVTLGDRMPAEAFEGSPRCRMVANFGVGTDHIDVAAAKRAGIAVSNTPGAVTDATADIAMTLILATMRRAGEGERILRRGEWPGWHPVQLLGRQVTGAHVGIVGMGRIGKAIARRCHAGFGMRVSFFNRSPVADPGVPASQVGTLTELAGQVDILVTAVPATPETARMIGAEVLESMKEDAIFVNIARGDVVDEPALIAALEAGRIAGAGLDVYAEEPEVPERLRALEQVTLLPHLGTAVTPVRVEMGQMAVANLIAFAEGREPPNAL